ncbi:ANTH-domain-containing protein [Pleurostoma richardsiae]|uniref:ANTH-domain-containing protein n=1 Tax=Pleurostoma richardsiae TaxID=41990 RepID=A0AA38VKN0_9PEZI|nr:ANTH-domain-containing protein [Pleurostoma richardsiae]
MSGSFEKSVKGATKIKLAPPKTKYIEHILVATHAGEAGVGEVFRALQHRLRDSTWTIVFKSLITVHLMIREGSPDVTLGYLAKHRNMLAISMFSDAQTQGRNIRHYANYLSERARAYRDTKCDWVRAKESRLEKLSVEKGLLRETEVVQHQLTALLKCDVLENEPENEITITAFRLLVLDLLALFQVLNQAMINILGHFFEMSKVDAERAMDIYRDFTKQTDFVVQYLSVARQYEHHTRVEVPKLKHAPVNLGRQLEDYLKDPDFEIHRRQYLAELEAKKRGGGSKSSKIETSTKASASRAFPDVKPLQSAPKPAQPTKGPDQNLIDFFDSIEQNQTTMATQPNPQQPGAMSSPWASTNMFQAQPTGQFQNGFVAQPTGYNPFQQQPQQPQQQQGFMQQQPTTQPLQPAFTGAGFGGFTPQPSFQPSSLAPIPQNTIASFQTGPAAVQPQQPAPQLQPLQTGQQSTNPFRQSTMLTGQVTGATSLTSPIQQQSTNPFARSSPQATQPFGAPASNSPFQSTPPPQQFPQQAPAPLLPMATGTNPFTKTFTGSQQAQRPQTSAGLAPQPTGSTNPFRQSAFVNHNTGMGWQHNQQPIGGGLDHLETVPVFPRPAQQSPWQ